MHADVASLNNSTLSSTESFTYLIAYCLLGLSLLPVFLARNTFPNDPSPMRLIISKSLIIELFDAAVGGGQTRVSVNQSVSPPALAYTTMTEASQTELSSE